MVPAAFVTLDSIPVTSNGKLDRRALPAPVRQSEARASGEDTSATGVEALLVQIWSEVLRLPTVSVHENFFEIGGDSILSIQICARARRHGVLIAPNQLFDYPTIAELALHARQSAAATAEQGPVTGEATLIPIQQWLLDQDLAEPDHWNAAIMLEVPPQIDDLTFRAALHAVVVHHDALRLRFERGANGWVQRFAPADAATMHFSTSLVASFEAPDAEGTIERIGAALQTSLNLQHGPLFGAVLIRERTGGRARMLMVAHHLVLDGFSWRLIIEDLITATRAIARGKPAAGSFEAKSNSVRDWASALERHAATVAEDAHERDWWARTMESPDDVPLDFGVTGSIETDAYVHTEFLDASTTHALLHVAPGVYRAQTNDLLIAALGMTLRDWTGHASHRIDMMGHGREALPEDLDVSRTVGWLTTLFPVALPLSEMSDASSAVRAARDCVARLPKRGLGFGLLRSFDQSAFGASLRAVPAAAVSFNYLGQFDQSLDAGWSLSIARTRCGPTRGMSNARPAQLEIDAMIVNGQLRIDWTASRTLHRPETVARLAAGMMSTLTSIVEGSAQSAQSLDADAFPLAGLDSAGLARLSALFDSGEWTDD
jgi:non-ribosomal peptide synthase protein (TIGR01720 family)